VNDFKAMLRMNTIIGNPVTTEDIVMAEQIFGTDIGQIKGKTTRRKPAPVVNDYIEIPKELIATQRKVTLCIDGMKVNGLSFLTTVSRNLQYRTAQYVKHQTVEVYCELLRQVIGGITLVVFKSQQLDAITSSVPSLNRLQTTLILS
jgi:hypothetical protein